MLTDNILKLIGNTPLLQLKAERIFAKAEFLNSLIPAAVSRTGPSGISAQRCCKDIDSGRSPCLRRIGVTLLKL